MVTFYLELNTNVSCQADNFFSQFNIVLFLNFPIHIYYNSRKPLSINGCTPLTFFNVPM
ncbi:hypothetical protein MAN88_16550 [Microcystis aeruginosa]|nr:hypothetical protein MAN88_16550 [Microcystis aeruginosa]